MWTSQNFILWRIKNVTKCVISWFIHFSCVNQVEDIDTWLQSVSHAVTRSGVNGDDCEQRCHIVRPSGQYRRSTFELNHWLLIRDNIILLQVSPCTNLTNELQKGNKLHKILKAWQRCKVHFKELYAIHTVHSLSNKHHFNQQMHTSYTLLCYTIQSRVGLVHTDCIV
jgi:hypothetical protein